MNYDNYLNVGNPCNDREPKLKECPICKGYGCYYINGHTYTCDRCDGSGEVVDDAYEEQREDFINIQTRKNRLF